MATRTKSAPAAKNGVKAAAIAVYDDTTTAAVPVLAAASLAALTIDPLTNKRLPPTFIVMGGYDTGNAFHRPVCVLKKGTGIVRGGVVATNATTGRWQAQFSLIPPAKGLKIVVTQYEKATGKAHDAQIAGVSILKHKGKK